MSLQQWSRIGMRGWGRWLAVLVCGVPLPLTAAEVIRLPAVADTSLYEHSSGRRANGAGSFLFAGKTGQATRSLRRTLLRFDLTELPAAAQVTDVQLSLSLSKSIAVEPLDYTVHRLLASWEEGETNAAELNPEEGQGDFAQDGDATWIHRQRPDLLWESPGGDFVTVPSATSEVFGDGRHAWSSQQLQADVSAWLDSPDENFGWILLGDETVPRAASRFYSRTYPDADSRPFLDVTYELASASLDCNGDGVVNSDDVQCSCALGFPVLEEVLAAIQRPLGDLDFSREVDFPDFLQLATHFGGPGGYRQGDLDCSGSVGFSDFLLFAAQFGRSTDAALVAVPEPSTGGALAMLLLSLSISRRFWAKTGLCQR